MEKGLEKEETQVREINQKAITTVQESGDEDLN